MHALALGTTVQLGFRYNRGEHLRSHREEIDLPDLREALPEDLRASVRNFEAVRRELAARGLRAKTRRRPRAVNA
jgi:hypothetical protein